jgi:hypothetical protein
VPPKALAVFLDESFDKQLGRADDRHGSMPRETLIPAGFAALDHAAQSQHSRPFAALSNEDQDRLIAAAEDGNLRGPQSFDSANWFRRARACLLLAFGSDPRGMVQMGFPGPSYKPGHVWLSSGEVRSRARRRPGYLKL